MSVARIASRYAKTLIDLAVSEKKLERIKEDVESFHKLASESKDFRNFLKSPVIPKDKKEQIIHQLIDGKYDELTVKFLVLLINKHREIYLPEVAKEFMIQYKHLKHITTVKVTSATELGDATLDKLKAKLKESDFVEDTVELEVQIDPELIGGFIIQFDDKVIDASIAHKLDEFKKNFRENLYVSSVEKS